MNTLKRLFSETGYSRRSVVLLLVGVGLGLMHHADHVLRADHSGWPFTGRVSPFTYSLAVYPIAAAAFALRRRAALSATLTGLILGFLALAHTVIEVPGDQYSTWANGVSRIGRFVGQPNLLHVASPPLGVAAVALATLLELALVATLISFAVDARRGAAHPSTAMSSSWRTASGPA
jgi:hypothetical protein